MNYHDITKCDIKNGEGLRVVLWVSGCSHNCKGCHNPQTWDLNNGIEFDEAAIQEIYNELDKDYTYGLTLTGGDPLQIQNRGCILELVRSVHIKYPDKNIWCYTGYNWEDIKDLEIIKYINVLVDGKYDENLNTPSPKWCGSRNQRVIDVKESIKRNEVILYCK